MSWKDVFIAGDDKDKKPEVKKDTTDFHLKFPSGDSPDNSQTVTTPFTFSTTPVVAQNFSPNGVQPDQTHLDNAVAVYQKGFDSLMQLGYGFYQFYKAIMTAGADNAQMYPMAFMMGSSMDKSVTKDKLLQQSDFYISKINEVYNNFINQGNSKKQDFVNQKNNEKQALSGELEMMHQQMEALKTQIADREGKLNLIDGKYTPMITEIDSKLAANDIAKNQIVGSINQVKNGIQNNLK